MRSLLILLVLAGSPALAQQPTAADIMARVAANQDRSQTERAHYVYIQHAHTLSRKGKTIRCEETTDFRVTPTAKGYSQQLLSLDGRLLHKGSYIHYDRLETKAEQQQGTSATGSDDDPMDRDLVENIRDNLTANDDKDSKDGIAAGLFPLTTREQADYTYTLAGRAAMNGRDCFHITFVPRDKNDYGWRGEAWIDATAFQPVVVRTTMARNVPFAVRTLLGTSVPGLGFTVTYAPQPADAADAVWFPVTFGTEFRIHVLFFLNRTIVLDVHNRDFERTHVHSTILGMAPATP